MSREVTREHLNVLSACVTLSGMADTKYDPPRIDARTPIDNPLVAAVGSGNVDGGSAAFRSI